MSSSSRPKRLNQEQPQTDYWRERLQDEVSLRTTGWERLGLPFNQALYRQRRRILHRLLRQANIPVAGARVLEVAPGTGFYLREWLKLGAREIVAVDISPAACAAVQAQFPDVRVECANWITVDPTQWGEFDLVTAFDVLFHFADADQHRQAIQNMAAACAPSGRVLFTDTMPQHAPPARSQHRLYSAQEYADTIHAAGLTMSHVLPAFVFMHPWNTGTSVLLDRIARTGWVALETSLALCPPLGYPLGVLLEGLDALLTCVVPPGPFKKIVACQHTHPPS